jgi:outer membrane protein assembly factor BamA
MSRRRWRASGLVAAETLRCANWLAIAVLVLFTSGPVWGVTQPPEDAASARVTIGSIQWSGVRGVEEAELADRILSLPADWRFWREDPAFDPETVQEDVDRIREFYRMRGYYNARVRYTLEWNEKRTRVDLHFYVSEGIPVVLSDFEVDGLTRFEPPEPGEIGIRVGLPLAVGGVFRADHYVDTKKELLRRLADRGFPAAQLEGAGDIDLATLTARVSWQVDPGRQVRLGEIRVEGLERVAEELVRRELRVVPGELYSDRMLRASDRAIHELGLFRTVAVKALEPEDEATVWPVVVSVRERSPRSLRLAVGYGTEDKFRARATLLHRNFLGGARKLSVTGKYSSLVIGAGSRLTQPQILGPDTELDLDVTFSRETPPAYDTNLFVARTELRRLVADLWTLRTGFFYERGDVTQAAEPADLGVSHLTFLEFGVQRSSLDNLIDTTKGSYFDVSLKPAFRALGSDVNYVKLEGVAHWYHPLWSFRGRSWDAGRGSYWEWAPVLALRAHLGGILPFDGSRNEDVPVFRRFYSGGPTPSADSSTSIWGPRTPAVSQRAA